MKRTLGVLLIVVISMLSTSLLAQTAPAESQLVTVNNVKINYVEQGKGDEVLVFVHGYAGSLAYWREVLKLLPEAYHGYALDLRGHGQSGQPGSYQLPEFVEDIYAFTQELGIEKFTYVGHSLGGKIGYQFALDHPDVLKGLFLVAPAPAHDFLPPDERPGFTAQMTSVFGSPEMIRSYLGQALMMPLSEELLNELINATMAGDPAAKEKIVEWWAGTNLEPELQNIEVPTLIVAGAKDSLPLDWERRYASQIEGCRFEVWEDDGHMIPPDSPQRLVDLQASFIEDVSKG